MTEVIGSLDANVILRLLVGDVPEQKRSAMRLLDNGPAWVSEIALAEVMFGLTRYYEVPRAEAADTLLGFIANSAIQCQLNVVKPALKTYRERPKLSFEDCLLVAKSEHEQRMPLWTFDAKLAAQTTAKLLSGAEV